MCGSADEAVQGWCASLRTVRGWIPHLRLTAHRCQGLELHDPDQIIPCQIRCTMAHLTCLDLTFSRLDVGGVTGLGGAK